MSRRSWVQSLVWSLFCTLTPSLSPPEFVPTVELEPSGAPPLSWGMRACRRRGRRSQRGDPSNGRPGWCINRTTHDFHRRSFSFFLSFLNATDSLSIWCPRHSPKRQRAGPNDSKAAYKEPQMTHRVKRQPSRRNDNTTSRTPTRQPSGWNDKLAGQMPTQWTKWQTNRPDDNHTEETTAQQLSRQPNGQNDKPAGQTTTQTTNQWTKEQNSRQDDDPATKRWEGNEGEKVKAKCMSQNWACTIIDTHEYPPSLTCPRQPPTIPQSSKEPYQPHLPHKHHERQKAQPSYQPQVDTCEPDAWKDTTQCVKLRCEDANTEVERHDEGWVLDQSCLALGNDMAEAQRHSSSFAVSAKDEHSQFLLSSTLILNRWLVTVIYTLGDGSVQCKSVSICCRLQWPWTPQMSCSCHHPPQLLWPWCWQNSTKWMTELDESMMGLDEGKSTRQRGAMEIKERWNSTRVM